MTPADEYRVKAGDLVALARAERDPFQKAEFERLSLAYLRLAEQADRNSQVYKPPPAHPVEQLHAQQQQQPQSKPDEE